MAKITERKRRESEFGRPQSVDRTDTREAQPVMLPEGPAIALAEPPGREWPEIPRGWLERSQWSPGAI